MHFSLSTNNEFPCSVFLARSLAEDDAPPPKAWIKSGAKVGSERKTFASLLSHRSNQFSCRNFARFRSNWWAPGEKSIPISNFDGSFKFLESTLLIQNYRLDGERMILVVLNGRGSRSYSAGNWFLLKLMGCVLEAMYQVSEWCSKPKLCDKELPFFLFIAK